MIKKRIIPVLLTLNNRLVKTKQFVKPLNVGNLLNSSKVYNNSDADELIVLNIDRQADKNIDVLIINIKQITKYCFMPLAFGGGIRDFNDADQLISNGADKVILNSICYKNYDLISEISKQFGNQSVVISIDAKFDKKKNIYNLYSNNGKKKEKILLENHLKNIKESGAGEVFINSIDNDGMKVGYDLNLVNTVKHNSNLPIIACGGAGNFNHIKDLFLKTNISAAACGSLFNFGDNNPIRAKAFLQNYDIKFRSIK